MRDIKTPIKNFLLHLMRRWRTHLAVPVMPLNKELTLMYEAYNVQRFYGPQKYFCYARFGSMFIRYDGRVSPCYACKAEGSLTTQTLSEIWNGQAFTSLREAFRAGDIPAACSFCRDHLQSKAYGSILANKYDHYLMSAKGFPVIAELELSNTCNLECIMCSGTLSSSIRHNREKLPPVAHCLPGDFISQFLPFLRNLNVLELTGGDPFLIDIYYDILGQVQNANPNLGILITTNANTFNEKVASLLEKNLKLSFNVSIDSLEEETYSKIRCNGSLSKALKNIERFSAYTQKHKTSLGFLICPLRENSKELPSFVPFAGKYQATLSYHVVFKPSQHALWSLDSGQLKELESYLSSFRFEGSGFVHNINVRSYNNLVGLVQSWYIKALQREEKKKETDLQITAEIEKSKKKLHQMIDNPAFFDTLDRLVMELEVKEFQGMVYMALVQKKPEELVAGFERFTKEELKHKLTLYHQDVYSAYFYQLGLSANDKYSENIV